MKRIDIDTFVIYTVFIKKPHKTYDFKRFRKERSMKKTLTILLCAILVVGTFLGSISVATAEELSGSFHILAGVTSSLGLKAVFAEYQKTHPNVEMDLVTFETVTDFETLMTTAIASNTMPDMYIHQLSSVTTQYAQEGYLMDLGAAGVMDQLIDGDTSLIKYNDWYFAFPMTTAVSVTLCNKDVLDSLGIELTVDNYPKSMDEFIALLQEVREKGIEYPYGIAGADASSCTAWPFQYMYQVIYGKDPNFYANVLKGEKTWDGEEFRGMFVDYDKIREYVSLDSTAKNMDSLIGDFIMGKTVFYNHVGTGVKNIHVMDPDINILLLPSSFTADPADQTIISGFDEAFSITTAAANPELCVDFLKYCVSPEGSTIFNDVTGYIPTTKGCTSHVDPAYDIVMQVMQAGLLPNSPILSRQWIAGYKELLKSGCQNWMAGESVDSIVTSISEQHTRLMDADPEWVQNFLSSYQWK